MTNLHPNGPPVALTVASAADRPLVRSMLHRYLAELGQHDEVSFDYPYFDLYWQPGEARWPYLLDVGTARIGFAFVRAHDEPEVDHSIAEFFILPHARGHGCGAAAACALWRAHPGRWEVSVMRGNAPAQRFWPRAIAAVGAADVVRLERNGGTVFRFDLTA
ncbi:MULTISPECIES: hypothetical protein [Burkholderia]|uniref:N-acetyltransferase domain-containing protein n=1 Tax=Burkholderia savannae TaxID=1637837 RepID=A0ABR5TBD4_9BURK|nr:MULTISPECIES: hypothetical protein [Burkholderia]AOK51239.1 hypothetical protein WT60_29555 [Burkholderia sp. MSMB617WGS]KVK90139.1 hypothetical protein WS91_27105 [Burkholderia sp. MSMB1498]KWZ39454.1 hypothetical protein WS72_30650 [Burkholderia savannae]KWZ49344.1 hypothetical protein WS73_10580 [Burkholderia savannae]